MSNIKSSEAEMVSTNSRIGIIKAGTSGVYLTSFLIQQGFQRDLWLGYAD